ncbi:hypothetical protein Gasu2_33640 [Galdieria sulphuraria]|nr:hypothetical protein Gasu2_33640 [Galdieria sulphuraria]
MVSVISQAVLWVVSLVILGIAVADIVYFGKIQSGGTVTVSEAGSMVVVSWIELVGALMVVAVLVFIAKDSFHRQVKNVMGNLNYNNPNTAVNKPY